MEVFSARLKWLRELKGLSQQDMADKLTISQSYYGRFERNKGEPNLETLSKLPKILGQSIDFMIGVTDYTHNCEVLKQKLDDAQANLTLIKIELQDIQINPHSKDIISKDFDPDNSESVKAKINFLQKNIPLYENRVELAKNKLLNMLDEIPFVSTETIDDINTGDPWQVLLNNMDE